MGKAKKASEIQKGDIIRNNRDELCIVAEKRSMTFNSPRSVNGFLVFPVSETPQELRRRSPTRWNEDTLEFIIPKRSETNPDDIDGEYRIDMSHFDILHPEADELDGGTKSDPNINVEDSIADSPLIKTYTQQIAYLVTAGILDPKIAVYLLDSRANEKKATFDITGLLEARELRQKALIAAAMPNNDIALHDALRFNLILTSEYDKTRAFLNNKPHSLLTAAQLLETMHEDSPDGLKGLWAEHAQSVKDLAEILRGAHEDFIDLINEIRETSPELDDDKPAPPATPK